jgi:hypothetical protein
LGKRVGGVLGEEIFFWLFLFSCFAVGPPYFQGGVKRRRRRRKAKEKGKGDILKS